jgi:hypothetical protein
MAELAETAVTSADASEAGLNADRATARHDAFVYQDGVMLSSVVRALDALRLIDDPCQSHDLPDNRLATLGPEGPTGACQEENRTVPW